MKRIALKAGFSRNELSFIAALILCVVVGTLTWGYRISEQEQIQHFENKSQLVNTAAGLRIAETRSFIKSIEGMHYASDEFAGGDIEVFVNQVRQYSPYLHSLGMFQAVKPPMLVTYWEQMLAKGLDSYTIHNYSEIGERIPVSRKERYLPVHSIAPLDNEHESLLGADLAGSKDIDHLLDTAIDTAESFITQSSEGWPFHTKYLLIQPLYFGKKVPDTIKGRRELFAGGIWVSLDPADLMYEADGESLEGILGLTLESGEQLSKIMISNTPVSSQSGIKAGFASLKSARTWFMGSSKLTLAWTTQPLMPLSHWVRTLVVLLTTLVVIIFALLFIYAQRRGQMELFDSLRALNVEREKAELTLASISDAVISLDSGRFIVYMNASASKLLCAKNLAELNKPIEYYLLLDESEGPGSPFPGFEKALAAIPSQAKAEYDVSLNLPHMKDVAVKLTLTSMNNEEGNTHGSIVVMKDVSKERKLTSELEYRANYDSLTGIFNRFHFEKRLHALLEGTVRGDRRHALCFFDLDNFKIVNDTFGHAAGDSLLCEVTAELKKNLRSNDILARLGGDEFGAVICDCEVEVALEIATQIHEFFKNYVYEEDGSAFSVSASIGFVAISKDYCDYKTIMSSADSACYAAKESGRNALVVYSEDGGGAADREEEINWVLQLQSALEHESFRLLVQPIGVLDTGGVSASSSHYEFLLRMLSPAGEEISPFKFIKSAERYDLMKKIDRWVLENALQHASEMQNRLNENCSFSVNLSGKSLSDPELLKFIREQFAANDVDPSCFWFEITETAAITQYSTAVVLLQGLRDMGAKIALDDFGSGVSSFGYLQKLPVNVLKIDGQFIKAMDSDPVAREMVKAIDQMAKVLGLETVAEHVESAAVVDLLSAMGVDYAQGFYLGRPGSIENALADRLADKAA